MLFPCVLCSEDAFANTSVWSGRVCREQTGEALSLAPLLGRGSLDFALACDPPLLSLLPASPCHDLALLPPDMGCWCPTHSPCPVLGAWRVPCPCPAVRRGSPQNKPARGRGTPASPCTRTGCGCRAGVRARPLLPLGWFGLLASLSHLETHPGMHLRTFRPLFLATLCTYELRCPMAGAACQELGAMESTVIGATGGKGPLAPFLGMEDAPSHFPHHRPGTALLPSGGS